MTARNVIVPTGTANLASVLAAFRRLGVDLAPARAAEEVDTADRVVLPGVGTFGSAADRLEATGLTDALRRRVAAGMPTLAVCVGMQILASSSEESPGAAGLGAVEGPISRFDEYLIVPQLAWSQVMPDPASRLIEPGWAYFANSYRLTEAPDGWASSTATYGKPFVAALERDGVLACQFHPELSGPWGSDLLQRWLVATGAAA
ncbi:MAG TPA: imidazole glycerol phosphate synthase subunit HisH [Acidimicrobiia bacterium]|nr:imidazole glycerol phosphate synthase subunit HisH [Acidimicrobiia bacterium]